MWEWTNCLSLSDHFPQWETGLELTLESKKPVIQSTEDIVTGLLTHLLIGSKSFCGFYFPFYIGAHTGLSSTLSDHPQEDNLSGFATHD